MARMNAIEAAVQALIDLPIEVQLAQIEFEIDDFAPPDACKPGVA